jgi:predicted enzyme related to lactoylglutathione lyase
MLTEMRMQTALPAVDFERAKRFYGETLGFRSEFDGPSAVMYLSGSGTRFVVFPSPNPNRGGHTQASWAVDDIESVVSELKHLGVVFEEYDFPALKTVDSVARVPNGRAAWFKDPEGNMLGLIEFSP